MSGLIKSDFKRVIKDKLFFVICILCVVFSAITPLIYKIIMVNVTEEVSQLLGTSTNAKELFFSSFSPANNLGLILPIFFTIILYKDFNFGTIRNKIIGGKTRDSIFMSMFITSTVFLCIIMLIHALLTLGISLLFFDYQATSFTSGDAVYLIESVGLNMLVYVFIAALTSFICVFSKNTGVAIILSIAINIVMTLVSSVITVAYTVISSSNGNSVLAKVLEFANNINIFGFGTMIGFIENYTCENLVYLIATPLVFTALLIFAGIFVFKKKDIK